MEPRKSAASVAAAPAPTESPAGPDPFPWLAVLETDNDAIDRDHREAVEEGNQLLRLIDERTDWPALLALLRQARGRCVRHFETEDRILERTRYPESAQHRRAHDDILAAFDRILAELEAVTEPEPHHWERAYAPRDLLVDHCLQEDLRFKSHLMNIARSPG